VIAAVVVERAAGGVVVEPAADGRRTGADGQATCDSPTSPMAGSSPSTVIRASSA